MSKGVVIVGAGQAGVQAAFSLRDEGFQGPITILTDETGAPYQKPPLSKAYLLGKLDDDGVLLKARHLYGEYDIRLLEGVDVVGIDREVQVVELRNGEPIPYSHLVLATGARQRTLDVPGTDLDAVFALRTIGDARALMDRLPQVRRAVVVGGGFIGLEFAAVLRARRIEVTIVEIAARPLGRALSTEMSRFFLEKHIGWGVQFLFGEVVRSIHRVGLAHSVELTSGLMLEADLVLIGAGVIPNSELAAASGLEVTDGIAVDGYLRTSDPNIWAIGDCALHPTRFSDDGPVRIESVQNATDQGRNVAAQIAGKPAPYAAVPWFWSDQGDVKLQIAGLGRGHDTAVVRGDPSSGAFSVFCFKQGRLLAVESVNRGPDHIMARRLLAGGAQITPQQAVDEAVPLRAHLAARSAE